MKAYLTSRFTRELEEFSVSLQNKFYKQLRYLINDLRHPSLHAKKYDEVEEVWQARVDQNVRFYFIIDGNTHVLLEIKKHPK